MKHDRGSAATEMVVLTPLLVVLILFGVYAGRSAGAATLVKHAADQGARAASLVAPAHMSNAAHEAVVSDLSNDHVECGSPAVDTFYWPGRPGYVSVTVSCTVSRAGLSVLGVGQREVSATSSEVIDIHRGGQ